ncbi:MAG TPA: TetR/AcrR family transcriptional regulator [Mycobacterium sp.]|nr:TetR/AcrR family transcriptional regulator [Mycobacterium sp.]
MTSESPGPPAPAGPRDRFVQAALTVLERDGPSALQARRVASEAGVSTMGVYSHFGGMAKLIEAMMREGFSRFAAHVRRVPQTDDPMADLMSGGLAYSEFALRNPQLYRLLFHVTEIPGMPVPSADTMPWMLTEGVDALSVLEAAVQRVIDAKRIRDQDARAAATQVLSVTHGFVLLVMAGAVGPQAFPDVMVPLTVNLMVGLGGRRELVEQSLATAVGTRFQRHGGAAGTENKL